MSGAFNYETQKALAAAVPVGMVGAVAVVVERGFDGGSPGCSATGDDGNTLANSSAVEFGGADQ